MYNQQLPIAWDLALNCGAHDPVRGSVCISAQGHTGDHQSIGGFAFENTDEKRATTPPFVGASEADLDAVVEILDAADGKGL